MRDKFEGLKKKILYIKAKNVRKLLAKTAYKFFKDKLSKNEFIFVHRPDTKNNKNGWQGRLCWDIPFMCSYNKINVDKNYGYLFFSKLNN